MMVNTAEKKITAQKFLRFSDENGKLPVSEINCGIEAHDGKLWFAATGGILKCSYNEKTRELEYELFDTSKGMKGCSPRTMWLRQAQCPIQTSNSSLPVTTPQPNGFSAWFLKRTRSAKANNNPPANQTTGKNGSGQNI